MRHAPSWMLFSVAAGAVNAGAFVACERFVTHVTGTATLIGMDAGSWVLMMDYALVLLAFIAGAMASVLALQARVYRGKSPLHALPPLVVAAVLVTVALAGHVGAFGTIGGRVEEASDFALLCVLAFAMGLMNASIGTSTSLAVRTTHLTGPATDFGVHLAAAWLTVGDERKNALRWAALRGGKLLSFCLGAALMVAVMPELDYLAFMMPAALISVAAVRSLGLAWRDSTNGLLAREPSPEQGA